MLPVHAEGTGDLRDLAFAFGGGQQNKDIHNAAPSSGCYFARNKA
jgi:hypothetical protein